MERSRDARRDRAGDVRHRRGDRAGCRRRAVSRCVPCGGGSRGIGRAGAYAGKQPRRTRVAGCRRRLAAGRIARALARTRRLSGDACMAVIDTETARTAALPEQALPRWRRAVLKVGSNLLAADSGGLAARQALAALGQAPMIALWQSLSTRPVAQVLLTHDDLRNRRRYLNARATLRELLQLGVLPVINENDTVSVDELKLGDNDNLAAIVAALVDADLLLIASD